MKRAIGIAAALVLWAVLAGSAFARVAYLHDATGVVTVRTGNQAPRPVRVGDLIDQGQTVATGDQSTAVVKFEDGQVMALHERSAFTIQQYSYNKQRVSESNAAFQLLQGGLRFITGVIGATNRNAVRLSASNATIGIRGTDGVVLIDAVTQVVTAAVTVGALAMTTPLGTTSIPVGAFSSASPTAPPSVPQPTAQAVAAVAQTLGALARAQNIPINTPVVVAASARAAAVQAAARADPTNTALQAQAQQALNDAVQAAQQALQQAIQAGAVPPAPPAPPPPPPAPTPEATPAPSTTTTTPSGTSGAGGGGGVSSPSGQTTPQ